MSIENGLNRIQIAIVILIVLSGIGLWVAFRQGADFVDQAEKIKQLIDSLRENPPPELHVDPPTRDRNNKPISRSDMSSPEPKLHVAQVGSDSQALLQSGKIAFYFDESETIKAASNLNPIFWGAGGGRKTARNFDVLPGAYSIPNDGDWSIFALGWLKQSINGNQQAPYRFALMVANSEPPSEESQVFTPRGMLEIRSATANSGTMTVVIQGNVHANSGYKYVLTPQTAYNNTATDISNFQSMVVVTGHDSSGNPLSTRVSMTAAELAALSTTTISSAPPKTIAIPAGSTGPYTVNVIAWGSVVEGAGGSIQMKSIHLHQDSLVVP